MAIVVVNEIEGANHDFYDRVNPKVMPNGQLHDGCQLHIAGTHGRRMAGHHRVGLGAAVPGVPQ